MKIAIFTECYIPEVNGVVYHINTLYEGLKQKGHEVLIIKPDFKTKKHYIENDILYCPAIKLKKLYNYSVSFPQSKKRLKILKDWKPDVIHIHTEYSQGLFGLYATKKLNIPMVYTIHTMYYDYVHYFGIFQNLSFPKKIIDSMLLKYIRNSEMIICASKKMENFILSITDAKPTFVIPNTCIVKNFQEDTLDRALLNKLYEKYNVNPSFFNICFCGRIAKEKNLRQMILLWEEFIKTMPESKLFIIGDGPDKKELENLVVALKIEKHVIFTGNVHHDMVKYYYHMCDAYFMVSTTENHSISALEANACGLPIVHIYDEKNEYQYIEGITGFAFKSIDEIKQIFKNIYQQNHIEKNTKQLKNRVIQKAMENDYIKSTQKIIEIYNMAIEKYNLKN